jgi:hypothetical protein
VESSASSATDSSPTTLPDVDQYALVATNEGRISHDFCCTAPSNVEQAKPDLLPIVATSRVAFDLGPAARRHTSPGPLPVHLHHPSLSSVDSLGSSIPDTISDAASSIENVGGPDDNPDNLFFSQEEASVMSTVIALSSGRGEEQGEGTMYQSYGAYRLGRQVVVKE